MTTPEGFPPQMVLDRTDRTGRADDTTEERPQTPYELNRSLERKALDSAIEQIGPEIVYASHLIVDGDDEGLQAIADGYESTTRRLSTGLVPQSEQDEVEHKAVDALIEISPDDINKRLANDIKLAEYQLKYEVQKREQDGERLVVVTDDMATRKLDLVMRLEAMEPAEREGLIGEMFKDEIKFIDSTLRSAKEAEPLPEVEGKADDESEKEDSEAQRSAFNKAVLEALQDVSSQGVNNELVEKFKIIHAEIGSQARTHEATKRQLRAIEEALIGRKALLPGEMSGISTEEFRGAAGGLLMQEMAYIKKLILKLNPNYFSFDDDRDNPTTAEAAAHEEHAAPETSTPARGVRIRGLVSRIGLGRRP